MGKVMDVRCKACGKTWRCLTGNGLLYADKENIITAFLQKEWEKVIDLLAASEIPAYDFQYRLSVCQPCHNVVSVPTVALSAAEEPYVGRCPSCGEQTGEICAAGEEEIWSKKAVCPVCGNRGLEAENVGYWD